MTIVYPINGKNERLGELFKTPKHLLLYRGMPAIIASILNMIQSFPDTEIIVLSNERYVDGLLGTVFYLDDVASFISRDYDVIKTPDTESQIETLRLHPITGPVIYVDCDIVPLEINQPKGNTVYLFKNELWMKQYSNYKVEDGKVIDCNEKGEFYPYAGAGLYYFESGHEFYEQSEGCKNISEVVKKLPFNADTTSKVFRFGTLNDIKNDEQLV